MTNLADALRTEIQAIVAAEIERHLDELRDVSTPWMTAEECASWMHVPVKRIRNLTSRNEIPHVRQGGRVLYDRREIESWLHRQRQGPRTTPGLRP